MNYILFIIYPLTGFYNSAKKTSATYPQSLGATKNARLGHFLKELLAELLFVLAF